MRSIAELTKAVGYEEKADDPITITMTREEWKQLLQQLWSYGWQLSCELIQNEHLDQCSDFISGTQKDMNEARELYSQLETLYLAAKHEHWQQFMADKQEFARAFLFGSNEQEANDEPADDDNPEPVLADDLEDQPEGSEGGEADENLHQRAGASAAAGSADADGGIPEPAGGVSLEENAPAERQ